MTYSKVRKSAGKHIRTKEEKVKLHRTRARVEIVECECERSASSV
jgi:hypothetical protein